jgi:hypothetical protein
LRFDGKACRCPDECRPQAQHHADQSLIVQVGSLFFPFVMLSTFASLSVNSAKHLAYSKHLARVFGANYAPQNDKVQCQYTRRQVDVCLPVYNFDRLNFYSPMLRSLTAENAEVAEKNIEKSRRSPRALR